MMLKLLLYLNTVKHLKFSQIYYHLFYAIKNLIGPKKLFLGINECIECKHLSYTFVKNNYIYKSKNSFEFLNISYCFDGIIEWELMNFGKLWQYNLTYFDFLNNSRIGKKEGLYLISSFINSLSYLKSSIEPYPTSLRVINWIRFVSRYRIVENVVNDAIFEQANYLYKNLEYHLLGNHLLENAFSLLHASKFFSNEKFDHIAKKILYTQLDEQILPDGGHFELSPMYHQIIFYRVLESIDLLKNNFQESDTKLLTLLLKKSSIMLCWLNNMTFSNGDIPLLNDSANGIAPSTTELREYSERLGIKPQNILLKSSGYRRFNISNYEAIFDVGQIGPNYQPGHGHADMLNILIHLNKKPLIVDVGTSTYQIGKRRQLERSTESHNTVILANKNQSQVWSSFRVAKRANIQIISEDKNSILASHDGFKNSMHQRSILFYDKEIIISDAISGSNEEATAFWHFHPDINVKIEGSSVSFNCGWLSFNNFSSICLEDYFYAPEFNKLVLSKKVKVNFTHELKTKFVFYK